ncbi:MAG: hypothetical protein HZT40_10815 [Candidatus Thiothrix singaporensis]|uniref:Uncharacterized protein n=1 Tax=Candidatus Thiothrix singaporensis TaxID=2799669 RepID=A0A7L6ASF3_9GAMM|nr:MAG: hypothetical protein HZT40_10815 [Candidatus Thiothrix singaporensis]
MTLSKYLKESVSGRTWEEAKQLYELQDQGLNDEEICRQANISERDLQRSRGAMALAEQYQDSEYGDQFSDNHYIIFHDLLRFNTFKEIREWLGWSDEKLKALDEKNTAIFFSLLSRLPDLSEEGEYIEPAIKTQDDLIYFILIIKSAMAMDFCWKRMILNMPPILLPKVNKHTKNSAISLYMKLTDI